MTFDDSRFDWIAKEYGARVSYPTRLVKRPRQRRAFFKIKVSPPEEHSFETIRSWDPFLQDDTLVCDAVQVSKAITPEDPLVLRWLADVQRIAAYFLLRSYIPCFDPIRLARLTAREETPHELDAVFELPEFNNYLNNTLRNAFEEAVVAVKFMATQEPSQENRETLWNDISNRVVPRIARSNRVNASTLRVLYSAYQKRIPFAHMGQGVFLLGWGAAGRLVSASTTEAESVIGMKLAGQKHVTAAILRDAGLPAPKHFVVSNPKAARAAAERLGWPVVVKPTDLERGEGVETDVEPDTIDAAVERVLALTSSNSALVEAQVQGVCHRLFVASGQLLYAVKRLPIGIYGDGEQSVGALVYAKYAKDLLKPTWDRSKIKPIDDLARAAIALQGLSERSIPAKGQFVPLRRIESTASGGVDEDVTDVVHPDNIKAAIAASRILGLSVAGIDIITDDITKSWSETGAIINEANFSPLLGGGDISRINLGRYLDIVLEGDGLIPVDVFVGGEKAMIAARKHVEMMQKRGFATFLASEEDTLDPWGNRFPLAGKTLTARVRALAFTRDVEALAIVVQSLSLLDGPLPLEFVDAVHHIEDIPDSALAKNPASRLQRLHDILVEWVRDPG